MKSTFKIGELASLYGIGPDTVRYYEEQGLITPKRGENGYRLYSIRELWRMNVIRDLRGLGFPLERIREYLENRSVENTLQLLNEELSTIDERMAALNRLKHNVQGRISTIREAETRPFDTIVELALPQRQCHEIAEPFRTDEEMDVLIKRLLNRNLEQLYIIGSADIGARIDLPENGDGLFSEYCAAFILDDDGPTPLPAGRFLTLRYKGSSKKTREWLPRMAEKAREMGLCPMRQAYEFIWIDIHQAADVSEHITELQLRVE